VLAQSSFLQRPKKRFGQRTQGETTNTKKRATTRIALTCRVRPAGGAAVRSFFAKNTSFERFFSPWGRTDGRPPKPMSKTSRSGDLQIADQSKRRTGDRRSLGRRAIRRPRWSFKPQRASSAWEAAPAPALAASSLTSWRRDLNSHSSRAGINSG
jgi:hypothetical protein